MNHCPNPDVDPDPARPERGRLPERGDLGAVSVDTTVLDLFRRIAAELNPGHTRAAARDGGVRRADGDPGPVVREESER